MKLTYYADALSFLKVTQHFLEKNEAANSLLLGLAIRASQNKNSELPFLCSSQDPWGSRIAALKTPGRFLILAAENIRKEDFPELAWQLKDMKGQIPGLLGEKELALCFAQAWEQVHGITYEVSMRQRVYQLDEVQYPEEVPGELRPASMEDVDVLGDWIYHFNKEATIESETPEGTLIAAHRRIEDQSLFIWENGEAVSMAGISRPTRNGITINAVYTPPEFRKKGYASACVAHLSGQMLGKGYRFCTLFTDLDYPTSNKIYQQIGYRPVVEFRCIKFLPQE